jgi:hypothetical protein
MLTPVMLPPGLGQAGNKPGGDEVAGIPDDRDRARRLLRRADCGVAKGEDDARLRLDQRFGELRQPLNMAPGEPDLDADVAAIDQPERRQRSLEPSGERLDGVRRVDA